MEGLTVKMTGKGKERRLEISIPVDERPSKSGKTKLIASTNGAAKTDVMVDGKNLVCGINCYIPA